MPPQEKLSANVPLASSRPKSNSAAHPPPEPDSRSDLPEPFHTLVANPLIPLALAAFMGVAWIARGAGLLGPVGSPLAMFFFGGLDLLFAAGLILAVPPVRYLAFGLFPLQALDSLWHGGSASLALFGFLPPAAMIVAVASRKDVVHLASYLTCALAVFLFMALGAAAGSAPPAARMTDTGFGVRFTVPPRFENITEVDDLARHFTPPRPLPHRLLLPFRSTDKSIGGFVLVDKVAVSHGVLAVNFAQRIVDDLVQGSDDSIQPERSDVALPKTWPASERAALEYQLMLRAIEMRGVVATLTTSDGRLIAVAAAGPAVAAARVRRAVELAAANLDITGTAAH